jgi:hypothetical protein
MLKMNRSYSKIRHIQESNQRLEKRFLIEESDQKIENKFISEQYNVPLLTVLANPALISMGAQNGSSVIYLTQRDAKGQVIPNSKYSYQVKGKYGILPSFDIALYNVRRDSVGDLYALAWPTSKAIQATLKTLVPNKNFDPATGYLRLRIPNVKINEAINKLRENKGSTAKIDAGNGVDVILTLIP